MSWDLSCKDWESRLQTGRSLVPDLPLDLVAGNRAVAVLNKLRLADVTGTPTFGEAGGDWFRDIVRAMFGCIDPVTKARAIRELFLLVPKKNSKTTNGALLMLTALLLNERPRAPFLLTAPFQKTADEAFSAIAGAVALDPVLERVLYVRDHLKTIVHRNTKANLQITTFDPSMITGKKVVGALIDELHVLGKMARADKAMLQLRGGMQPFPEAFLATITTQSDEAPSGVFKDDLQKARSVRDGIRQSSILPVLYEFPEAMQRDPAKPWLDRTNWPMVTPNVGRSVDIDRLDAAFRDEEEKGEGAIRLWASQHLNIEIGLALHANRWTGADFWEAAGSVKTLAELVERSDVIMTGVDGGGLDDWLALSVLGRDADSGRWLHWGKAWVHPVAMERRKSEASRWSDFIAQGDLVLVERVGQDIEGVTEVHQELEDSGKLMQVGVDPIGISDIEAALNEIGILKDSEGRDRIIGIPQGYKLTGTIKTVERRLAEGALEHCSQPVMAWSVGNAKVEARGNAVIVTKQAAGACKIDLLVSLFNAAALMALAPEPDVCTDEEVLAA